MTGRFGYHRAQGGRRPVLVDVDLVIGNRVSTCPGATMADQFLARNAGAGSDEMPSLARAENAQLSANRFSYTRIAFRDGSFIVLQPCQSGPPWVVDTADSASMRAYIGRFTGGMMAEEALFCKTQQEQVYFAKMFG